MNNLLIAFLHRDPKVGVQSPPETGKSCDITYYIATIPLPCNPGKYYYERWLFGILCLLAHFLIGNKNKWNH